ncbi:hypothetical protein HK099_004656 [Clydaea vesicula]|uniref:Uncharacterized protein n=1 Tax=Clydaea vesicula TaxID=447962 RepID=A0AAD5U0H6_9FUNG|nr:hypothetical protein HK099_004656 [Clydaea vesicula]KAJ3382580.1 hypothetical protein HDU92_004677 [Lobulomyces angularis]
MDTKNQNYMDQQEREFFFKNLDSIKKTECKKRKRNMQYLVMSVLLLTALALVMNVSNRYAERIDDSKRHSNSRHFRNVMHTNEFIPIAKKEVSFTDFDPEETIRSNDQVQEVILKYTGHSLGVLNLVTSEDVKECSMDIKYKISDDRLKDLFIFNQQQDGDKYMITVDAPKQSQLHQEGCILLDEDYDRNKKYYKREGSQCEIVVVEITLTVPNTLRSLSITAEDRISMLSVRATPLLQVENLMIKTMGMMALHSDLKVLKSTRMKSHSTIYFSHMNLLGRTEIVAESNIILILCGFIESHIQSYNGLIYADVEVTKAMKVFAENGDVIFRRLKMKNLSDEETVIVDINSSGDERRKCVVALQEFAGHFALEGDRDSMNLVGYDIMVENANEMDMFSKKTARLEGRVNRDLQLKQKINMKCLNSDVVMEIMEF